MNLRKILLILAMIIALIIGSVLLWKWWLLPSFFAGLVYIRIGWWQIIKRRELVSKIYNDFLYYEIIHFRYFRHVFFFPLTFFVIIIIIEINNLKNEKIKWPLRFLISYKKKSPPHYKAFVTIFWLPLLAYAIIMCIVGSFIFAVFGFIYFFIKVVVIIALKIAACIVQLSVAFEELVNFPSIDREEEEKE